MLTLGTDAEFVLYNTTNNHFERARSFFEMIAFDPELDARFDKICSNSLFEAIDDEDDFLITLHNTEIGLDGDTRLLELRPMPKRFTPKSVARRMSELLKGLNELLPEEWIVLRLPAGCGHAGAHIHFRGVPPNVSLLHRLDRSLYLPSLLRVPYPLYLRRIDEGWGQLSSFRDKEGGFEYRALNNHFASEEYVVKILKRCRDLAAVDAYLPEREPVEVDLFNLSSIKKSSMNSSIFPPREMFFEDVLSTFGIREREDSAEVRERIKRLIQIDYNIFDYNLERISNEIRVRPNYPVYLYGLRNRERMHPNGSIPDIWIDGNMITSAIEDELRNSISAHRFQFKDTSTILRIGLARRIRESPSYTSILVEQILKIIGDLLYV